MKSSSPWSTAATSRDGFTGHTDHIYTTASSSRVPHPTGSSASPGFTTAPRRVHAAPRRLKVAVVGDVESGRTSLCKSLEGAALRKTRHPLVISGSAAALKMSSSVLSVRTFDVAPHREGEEAAAGNKEGDADNTSLTAAASPPSVVEVTIVDSGPAPWSSGAASSALMEADVVLLCFSLVGIKQITAQDRNRGNPEIRKISSVSSNQSTSSTQAFIHTQDCRLLQAQLTHLSTRCGRRGLKDTAQAPLPTVFLVATFQNTLRDASVAATHTILRSLRRLCDRMCTDYSPECRILPVADVFAISAVQLTCVSLQRSTQFSLHEWWRMLFRRVWAAPASPAASQNATTAASDSNIGRRIAPSAPSDAVPSFAVMLRHLMAHPNPLRVLHANVQRIFSESSSPCLLRIPSSEVYRDSGMKAIQSPAPPERAIAEMHAQDARVTSLVIDFIAKLKNRQRLWLLPLPKLWRVAYALGMQTKEQLYLVVRQMEAVGEVSLLGRGLSFLQVAQGVNEDNATKETACLCPGLLPLSLSILYVYVDWMRHRQRRHVHACLRDVDLDQCARRDDPQGRAVTGVFTVPLLRRLAEALRLRHTSRSDAAEVITEVLVGADLAYLHCDTPSQTERNHIPSSPRASREKISSASRFQDPLQPPPFTELPASSSDVMTDAVSPVSSTAEVFTRTASTASSLPGAIAAPILLSSAGDSSTDVDEVKENTETQRQRGTFSAKKTVAELTSLFLLGEFTAVTGRAQLDEASSSSLFDPLRTSAWGSVASLADTPRRSTLNSPRGEQSAKAEDKGSRYSHLVLVVPSLQPPSICPESLIRYWQSCISAWKHSHQSTQPALRASEAQMRFHPVPCDLVALLTCRLASLALGVQRADANAALLTFNVTQLLHPALRESVLASHQLKLSADAAPLAADACLFFYEECDEESASGGSSRGTRLLHLCYVATSVARLSFLESALSSELRRLLLQRLPGVGVTPVRDAREECGGVASPALEHLCGGDADVPSTIADLVRATQTGSCA